MPASVTSACSKITARHAGQEFEHPNSQLTATTFIPRRVLYELRAAYDYFKQKERCVFCDIMAQEMSGGQRAVEMRGDYVALCPYATACLMRPGFCRARTTRPLNVPRLARPAACATSAGLLQPQLAAYPHYHRVFSPGAAHLAQPLSPVGEPGILEDAR